MKTALITGITGQDGSYLAEFLLQKGYLVIGIIRRTSSFNSLDRLQKAREYSNLKLVYGDMLDGTSINKIVREWYENNMDMKQFEVYNLAAQSHVKVSFDLPEYTNRVNVMGIYNILNAIISLPKTAHKKFRFYQASSSEMYGLVQEIPQTEKTPFYPRSPYAVSKVTGYWCTINYRESYNLFACNGILFNHESVRRGENFVTRKITRQIAEIYAGKRESVVLGNLNAKRDWGSAKDYVEAMWLMLQHNTPDDFVISTGKQYSVRDFVEIAFKIAMNITIAWKGEGVDEIGYDQDNPERILIRVSEEYFRPAEVETLLGSANKAKEILGWEPKISFEELVKEMVTTDIRHLKN